MIAHVYHTNDDVNKTIIIIILVKFLKHFRHIK